MCVVVVDGRLRARKHTIALGVWWWWTAAGGSWRLLAASIFQKSLPASAQSSFRAPAAANAKCSQINETIIFVSSAACRGFVGDQPKVPKTARTIVGVSSNCLRHCSRNWSTYVLARTTPQNHFFYMHQGDTLRDHVFNIFC